MTADAIVKCSRCDEPRSLSQMSRDRVKNGVIKYRKYCKECRRKEYKAKRFGREIPWKDRLTKIKTRANQKGIECTIDAEYLEWVWNLQKGRCVYTQDRMLTEYGLRNHPQVVSVDRINPASGYVPGNVVLCTARANSIKQDMTPREFKFWMPVWYLRLKLFEHRRNNARND